MKSFAFAFAFLGFAAAFAPQQQGARMETSREAIFDRITNMDLWKDVSDSNEYGARKKKNIKLGEITSNSYVPAGLTKEQYNKIRKAEKKKRDENYERNVKKAFKFVDFTDWYAKRGTSEDFSWRTNKNTLGHTMAKTKYDWSGTAEGKKFAAADGEQFAASIFGLGAKKAAPKAAAKKAAPKKKKATYY